MNPLDLLHGATPTGTATVPDALRGCWRRNWIQFGPDNERERHVQVIWLQTISGMGDLRIDPRQAPHETDSSCGITVVDGTTQPYVTADWHDGAHGFAQQPVSNFPEKGWLVWDSPSIMRELAPSGAYVEEWERFDDSTGPTAHLSALGTPTPTNLYIAGTHVLLAVKSDSPGGVHEFSWGRYSSGTGDLMIELSTHAHSVGQPFDLDHQWQILSYCD